MGVVIRFTWSTGREKRHSPAKEVLAKELSLVKPVLPDTPEPEQPKRRASKTKNRKRTHKFEQAQSATYDGCEVRITGIKGKNITFKFMTQDGRKKFNNMNFKTVKSSDEMLQPKRRRLGWKP